ncbi:hypothetical protein EJ08DRAFT_696836 [Tothia fuscella]|uniref:Uncharacterized protein n=1 Tax=Tothia fuscella TaxID=1048955 RepID=A0A9P4NRN7_9PEZI|nr:hypothetical protein EJ08DRAFT_696836 [Tothia fuscella]
MVSHWVNGKKKVQALQNVIQQLDQINMCICIVYWVVLWLAHIYVNPATTPITNLGLDQYRTCEESLAGSCSTDFKTYIKAFIRDLVEVRYLNGSEWISSSMFWSFDEFFATTFMSDTGVFITAA